MKRISKGEIWNRRNRNLLYYCMIADDDFAMMADCIVDQGGNVLVNENSVTKVLQNDCEDEFSALTKTTVEEIMKDKFNFNIRDSISFKHGKYSTGGIEEIDSAQKRLVVEVEDVDTAEYKEIKISFDSVLVNYRQDCNRFNTRHRFEKLNLTGR